MRDPDLVQRAERAAIALERAWDHWRTAHGHGSEPLPPVSSYVGYSLGEPWGQPRVVFGIAADEAEELAGVLDGHDCFGPVHAEISSRSDWRRPAATAEWQRDDADPAAAGYPQLDISDLARQSPVPAIALQPLPEQPEHAPPPGAQPDSEPEIDTAAALGPAHLSPGYIAIPAQYQASEPAEAHSAPLAALAEADQEDLAAAEQDHAKPVAAARAPRTRRSTQARRDAGARKAPGSGRAHTVSDTGV